MHQFVAGLEALGHKRQHYAILFFFTAEERAGMTGARLQRSTDAYGLTDLFHGVTHSLGTTCRQYGIDREKNNYRKSRTRYGTHAYPP
jgi:hypothetical protein